MSQKCRFFRLKFDFFRLKIKIMCSSRHLEKRFIKLRLGKFWTKFWNFARVAPVSRSSLICMFRVFWIAVFSWKQWKGRQSCHVKEGYSIGHIDPSLGIVGEWKRGKEDLQLDRPDRSLEPRSQIAFVRGTWDSSSIHWLDIESNMCEQASVRPSVKNLIRDRFLQNLGRVCRSLQFYGTRGVLLRLQT